MTPNTYKNIWVRWVHSTWESEDEWRTDIRPSVLNNPDITIANFILDDGSCVFIPMDNLRNVLKGKQPNRNGSIGPFNVNPKQGTVDGIKVPMQSMHPKS